MRILLFFLISSFLLIAKPSYTQINSISFEELDSLKKKEPRHTLVFLHTNWCKYCEAMSQTTFINLELKKLLETEFYFISFDAEDERAISFNGKTFSFIPNGYKSGSHELASELASIDGKVSYPTIVLMNENFEILYKKSSFHSANEIIELLNYFE